MREIARQTGHHQATIARVVKAEEVQEYVKQLREKLFAVGDEAVERIRTEIRSGKQGAWLAYQILKDIGVIAEQDLLQPSVAPPSEEDEIRKIAIMLTDGALRRQKYFGLPIPKLDEVSG